MDDELQFFQAWWNILRKYWNPPAKANHTPQADAFWDGLCEDCRELRKHYENNELFAPFATKMCLDLISEIERRSSIIGK